LSRLASAPLNSASFLVLRISQMFHLGSARYRRLGDPQANELNQVTESEH
jgi:hypothetical protein